MEGERAFEQLPAFVDLVLVPERAVLVVEQDELAAAEAGGAARVVDEHEREQGVRFGFVGHQLDQGAAEADRVCGQVDAAAAPALVEDQVDDREHGVEPLGQQVVGRDGKRYAGVADLVLGACQALAHRLERDEERACDLLG